MDVETDNLLFHWAFRVFLRSFEHILWSGQFCIFCGFLGVSLFTLCAHARHPIRASLMAQLVNHLPVMQETWVWSLGREDPLEEGMATHSSILAWRIPWTEEAGGLQSTRSQESDTTKWLNHHPHHHLIKLTYSVKLSSIPRCTNTHRNQSPSWHISPALSLCLGLHC